MNDVCGITAFMNALCPCLFCQIFALRHRKTLVKLTDILCACVNMENDSSDNSDIESESQKSNLKSIPQAKMHNEPVEPLNNP